MKKWLLLYAVVAIVTLFVGVIDWLPVVLNLYRKEVRPPAGWVNKGSLLIMEDVGVRIACDYEYGYVYYFGVSTQFSQGQGKFSVYTDYDLSFEFFCVDGEIWTPQVITTPYKPRAPLLVPERPSAPPWPKGDVDI